MRIDVITLFPEVFAALNASIPGRAQSSGALELHTHQLRVHAVNKHGQVDDTPYGGEAGMVLRPEPLRDALQAILREERGKGGAGETGGDGGVATDAAVTKPHVIYMSAQGRQLDQQRTAEIAALKNVVIVCGHYKGVDQRFIDAYVDEEISIGDYVLSGGEIPAMVLIDAVARLLPGVIGDIDSADTDSHARPGRLGWPVYTRPQEFEGVVVPEVLLSGHHANIGAWQTLESLRLTRQNRPDLLEGFPVTAVENDLLDPHGAKARKKAARRKANKDAEKEGKMESLKAGNKQALNEHEE